MEKPRQKAGQLGSEPADGLPGYRAAAGAMGFSHLTDDLTSEAYSRMADLIVRERRKLYWRMLANGQLSSLGWKMAEYLEINGHMIHYRCWPMFKPEGVST